jgi:hypothetical protein
MDFHERNENMANTNKGGAAAKGRAKSRTKALAEEISRENVPDSPVVEHLQRQVANALVLYLNYKHYHWQTYGPMFRDLHRLFDEFAEAVLGTIDEFAERVRMIGRIRSQARRRCWRRRASG